MKVDLQLPSFEGATEWLNRQPVTRQTKGHPTLVHFWSISSEESKANLSQVADLRDQRKREGFRVVAVHVPQSETEKSSRRVREAIGHLNLTEPCVLDNELTLSKALLNGSESLPAYYLFDHNGELCTSASGANGLQTVEEELDQMLADLRA